MCYTALPDASLMRKLFHPGRLLWLAVSLAWSAGMMRAAWVENPGGELHELETGSVVWSSWLPIGISWFVFVGLVPLLVLAGIAWGAGRQSQGGCPKGSTSNAV